MRSTVVLLFAFVVSKVCCSLGKICFWIKLTLFQLKKMLGCWPNVMWAEESQLLMLKIIKGMLNSFVLTSFAKFVCTRRVKIRARQPNMPLISFFLFSLLCWSPPLKCNYHYPEHQLFIHVCSSYCLFIGSFQPKGHQCKPINQL